MKQSTRAWVLRLERDLEWKKKKPKTRKRHFAGVHFRKLQIVNVTYDMSRIRANTFFGRGIYNGS